MTEIEQARAQAAYQVQEEIQGIITQMRRSWVELAKHLYRFHDLEMWRHLGHGSFEEWIAGPDIDLGYRQAYVLIETWREVVIQKGTDPAQLEGIRVTKLREALPAIRRNQVTVEEALADAQSLSRQDMRDRYGPSSSALTGPSNVLDAEQEPQWDTCQVCGSRIRVYTPQGGIT